jgi:hypothetical protein
VKLNTKPCRTPPASTYNIPSADVLDDYHTLGTGSITKSSADYNYRSNLTEAYDLIDRQTVLCFLYGRFEDPESNSVALLTRFVCVTPVG